MAAALLLGPIQPTATRPALEPIPDARPRHRRVPTVATVVFVLMMIALVAATVWLRLYHQTTSYEVSIDEIQYADVSNSIAKGTGPELFGDPFFLHPPLFFLVVGAAIAEPVTQVTIPFVLGVRWVVVLFAGVNVLLAMEITRRIAGRGPALVAGLLYALDPFIVRFDSRLFLEAPMMATTLGGVLALTVAVTHTGRSRWLLLVTGGLLFGAAVTTKSTAALVTAVPMLILIASGWVLRRREALAVFATQVGFYAVYVVIVALTGRFPYWFEQTLGGIFRAVGVHKETGFNAVGTPSFTDRLLANLGVLGPSYLLIGLAFGFIGWQMARVALATARKRAVAARPVAAVFLVWLTGILIAVAYTFFFGEVEEQTFYMLSVPAAMVVGVMTAKASLPWRLHAVVMAAVPLVAAVAATAWWGLHTGSDDAYRRMEAFLSPQAGKGVVLAIGEHTAMFVSPGFGLVVLDDSLDSVRTARYALVSTELSALGFAPIGPSKIEELSRRYPVAFETQGRTAGRLILFDLSPTRPTNQGVPR